MSENLNIDAIEIKKESIRPTDLLDKLRRNF
jgi:hypothetical protein